MNTLYINKKCIIYHENIIIELLSGNCEDKKKIEKIEDRSRRTLNVTFINVNVRVVRLGSSQFDVRSQEGC